MNALGNVPAIEISAEQSEQRLSITKDAKYWHDQATKADKIRSDSSLDYAEALYELSQGGYQDLGYQSLAEYVFKCFNRSKQWAEKLIAIYKKFVIDLGKTKEELKEVGFGKLSKLQSIAQESNVDEILEDAKGMTQKEIDEKIKESQGLEPNETKVKDDQTKLTFTGPAEGMDVVKSALQYAKEDCAAMSKRPVDQVSDFHVIEHLSVMYIQDRKRFSGRDRQESITKLLNNIANKQNIDIKWTDELELGVDQEENEV